jgi:hypothetical protein
VTFSAATLDGPGSRTIAVQVTDNGGLSASDQATVAILNLAPTASFSTSADTLDQGQSATLRFSDQVDPSAADSAAGFRYTYDCTGDGTAEIADSAEASAVCSYPDAGIFSAHGRIADKDGGFTEYTVQVQVRTNQAPVLTLPGQQNVQYSDPLAFTVSATDPDNQVSDLTFTATGLPHGLSLVDNGNGTARVAGAVQAAAGTYAVEVTVTDTGGLSDTRTVPIVVSKEDARLTYSGTTLVKKRAPVTLRATVAEVADGSTGDVTKAVVFFDVIAGIGGTKTTYGPVAVSPAGEASFTLPMGLDPNVYAVDSRIDPANGYYQAPPAATTSLVAYGPSEGFTIGAGSVQNGATDASFGFGVRYLKGGATVKGEVVYIFRAGATSYRLQSTAIQWLVITDTTAVFRGKATLNRVGNHTFEITVVDNGSRQGDDTFAIKIWRPDGTLLHTLPVTHVKKGIIVVAN